MLYLIIPSDTSTQRTQFHNNRYPFIEIMDKKNSITVNNRSGAVQNYVLFAEAPSITPSDGEIHTNIIVAFRGVSGNSGEAFFTMPSERLFAICGTSNTEELENDIQIEITDKMPVNMGTQTETGSLIRGTTCDVTTSAGTPTFSAHQTAPPMGELGAFCIRTTDDFTYQNAEEGI